MKFSAIVMEAEAFPLGSWPFRSPIVINTYRMKQRIVKKLTLRAIMILQSRPLWSGSLATVRRRGMWQVPVLILHLFHFDGVRIEATADFPMVI